MSIEKDNPGERKFLEKEYIHAVVGSILAGMIGLMALFPIAGLVLGLAVRCYRWAAG